MESCGPPGFGHSNRRGFAGGNFGPLGKQRCPGVQMFTVHPAGVLSLPTTQHGMSTGGKGAATQPQGLSSPKG